MEAALLTDASSVIFSQDLSEPVAIPLYLTTCFLVYLAHSLAETSHASIKTYIKKRITELALEDWHQIKSVNPPHDSNGIKASWLASFIAYEAFKESTEKGVDIKDIEVPGESITRFLVDLDILPSTEKVKQELSLITNSLNRSEILQCNVSASHLHQEYRFQQASYVPIMAAVYLAGLTAIEREQILVKRLKSTDWDSIILYTFDLLLTRSPIEANLFIDFLIKNENLSFNDCARMLHLAGCCATHAKRELGTTKKVIDNILITLSDKDQKVDLEYRIKIAETMGAIRDPRLGAMESIPQGEFRRGYDPFPNDRPVEKIWVDEFKIDIYPVSNFQYAEFINGGGYKVEQYWNPNGWRWIQETGRHQPRYWTDPRFNKNNYPVVGISW